MTRYQPRKRFDLWLAMKKLFLSGFVVFSFLLYVIDQQLAGAKQAAQPQAPGVTQSQQPRQAAAAQGGFQGGDDARPLVAPTPAPTQAPPVVSQPLPARPQGQYKDGTYNGNVADAFYGNLQVQAVIQGGRLTNIQILDYPHDRRTSQYINSQALPWLEQEAIQAQTANVNFISGATLSSDAFMQSLSSALYTARNS